MTRPLKLRAGMPIALALATSCLAGEIAQAQDISAWTKSTPRPDSEIFVAPDESAIIFGVTAPHMDGQSLKQAWETNMAFLFVPQLCPDLASASLRQLNGGDTLEGTADSPEIGAKCYGSITKFNDRLYAVGYIAKPQKNADTQAAVKTWLAQKMGQPKANSSARAATPSSSKDIHSRTSVDSELQTPAGLVGLWRSDWVENQFRYPSGLTLVALSNSIIFSKSGLFMLGVGEGTGMDDASIQAVMREQPDTAGRYVIQGNRIILNYASGDVEDIDYRKDKDGISLNYRGKFMSPKILFPDGYALSGIYSSERITNAGSGIFVVGNDDYSFAPDGRFAQGSSVSMTSDAVSSVGGREGRTGRYIVKGSALYLSYDDGETRILSMFQEEKGGPIWFNDEMFSKAQ
ncbi:hypothetical protein ACFOWX_11375 [Sphingorhabdus arenilitoris]|uniref:Uncharacterized protein n=1 Tax=Sphingorhabdus arenilitoris TaxID=1490041 RepID=A0ABV8RJQ8_9SPHN